MVAIVTGSNGQDGSYMCDLLKSKGYYIIDLTKEYIHLLEELIKTNQPDEVYNFAGISNVINPFENVSELMDVNIGLPAKILNAILKYSLHTKYFQASSALIFGREEGIKNEQSTPAPLYPYGISKLAADYLVKEYRQKFGIYACSGIMFPHESERRKDHFFTKKVINAAKNKQPVTLKNLNTYRDFGYAPDFMEAAWLMLQQDKPKDYVIGTGRLTLLIDWVKKVFKEVGLEADDYVTEDGTSRNEPTIQADISSILEELEWMPIHTGHDLIKAMLHDRIIQPW